MKQAKKYPAPQISEAVFRGRNSLYNFEVYPMNVRFNEVPAVYIISKRKVDRNGRGHHFLVCIGQTESLVEDIKKHKRGQCIKQLNANTVSVILEDDENRRLEVETDLKSAHPIPCHHESVNGEFTIKSIVKSEPQKVKIEARGKTVPQIEIPSKLVKKPAKKQAEVKAEVSKPKKAKLSSAQNKVEAKADSGKVSSTSKKQKVEKKVEAIESKKPVRSTKKTANKKFKPKVLKAEVSKAKKTAAPKPGKTKINKKVEILKPKKVSLIKAKVEKKPA